MSSLVIGGVILLVVGGGLTSLIYYARKSAKKSVQLELAQKRGDDVEKALKAVRGGRNRPPRERLRGFFRK